MVHPLGVIQVSESKGIDLASTGGLGFNRNAFKGLMD